jgi:hypothetical protein
MDNLKKNCPFKETSIFDVQKHHRRSNDFLKSNHSLKIIEMSANLKQFLSVLIWWKVVYFCDFGKLSKISGTPSKLMVTRLEVV